MSTSKRILVVDDEYAVRELFEDVFVSSGYELYSSEDAESALEILKKKKSGLYFSI